MNEFYREIKLGDDYRGVRAEIQDADRQPVDLTGKTVTFKARTFSEAGSLEVLFEEPATIESYGAGGEKAIVFYSPQTRWFDEVGTYFCDFKIYDGDIRESFPENDRYIEISVLSD